MGTRVHIIHHTHWDMEWYFSAHDTNALFNYSLGFALDNLEKNDETFLFDGQVAPFENVIKNQTLFKRIKNLVENNKLKIGPWYSQPDLRLTSDEGIQRNYHYGQELNGLKSNQYSYLYTPDTFGFGENIPSIYQNFNKKYAVLWRGVNRHKLKDAPIFKWVDNSGASIIVYNIASGYFVARYLKDDHHFESLYQNNILPSIKRQSANGQYSVVAMPSGGDQQPYNDDLKNAIKRLNAKNDGNQYLLSSWEAFFKELAPQIHKLPTYQGAHTLAYGGRIHKLVGAHRPDIKKLIYKTEMKISRLLEPMLLMSSISQRYYPELELDQMWKKILLSQAHDAYASCNSDKVNSNIKNRLLAAKNIYESNKDLLIRFMAKNYQNNSLLIFNPTQFSGHKIFQTTIATNSKDFIISDKGQEIDYVIVAQHKIKGGVKVTYTGSGEVEKQLPDVCVSKIKFIAHVLKTSVLKYEVIEKKSQIKKVQLNWNVEFQDHLFHIRYKNNKTTMDINFHLDGGDGYDLDLYDEIKPFKLKDALVTKEKEVIKGKLAIIKYKFLINLPSNFSNWKRNIRNQEVEGEIEFSIYNKIDVKFTFNNLTQNLLIQPQLTQKHRRNYHCVLTHNGYIKRQNKVNIDHDQIQKLREKPTDFDIMHGNVLLGDQGQLSIASLDIREYKIDTNEILLNILRTPDVLGRANLRIRPGRPSGLSDKEVKIPQSTSELNHEPWHFSLGFNLSQEALAKIVDGLIIDDLAIHQQNLYKYYSNVNTWTLPNIRARKTFVKSIDISNQLLVLQAFFKSRGYYYLRVNNPFSRSLKTNIKIFDKEYQNVIIKANESKTITIKT